MMQESQQKQTDWFLPLAIAVAFAAALFVFEEFEEDARVNPMGHVGLAVVVLLLVAIASREIYREFRKKSGDPLVSVTYAVEIVLIVGSLATVVKT